MDRNDDAMRHLEKMVEELRPLTGQVSRLEGLLTGFERLRDDVVEHGQELAKLQEWRQAHDAAESKRAGRTMALVGILGAVAGKLLDWLHAQYLALAGHSGH